MRHALKDEIKTLERLEEITDGLYKEAKSKVYSYKEYICKTNVGFFLFFGGSYVLSLLPVV
jgi:hypothetical protein